MLSCGRNGAVRRPFRLAQVDTKDIFDTGTVGTRRWDHLHKHHLLRYQWTFLESRTRCRLLAYSHELNVTNGLCVVSLVMSWLWTWGMTVEAEWQADWGGLGMILSGSSRSRMLACTVRMGPAADAPRRGARGSRGG